MKIKGFDAANSILVASKGSKFDAADSILVAFKGSEVDAADCVSRPKNVA